MAHAHNKAHKATRPRKTVAHPQFVRSSMKQNHGPQHTTIEGFISSIEADVEARRELQDFE